jgi:hypothetical protein
MSKHFLLRSQKNDVYKILCEVGLETYVSQFKWKEGKSEIVNVEAVSKIVSEHDGHTYYFTFDSDGESFRPVYFPGSVLNVVMAKSCSWDITLAKVRNWAIRIKRDFQEPDYWAEYARIQPAFIFDTNNNDYGTPISVAEASKLKEGISLLYKRIVEEFALDQYQRKLVLDKLSYLAEAVERLGKADWVNLAIGVFATVAVTIGVSAANSDKFWRLVKDSFKAFQLLITM